MRIKISIFTGLLVSLFSFAGISFAQSVPSVTSFSASPQSINNAYSTSVSWNITNGGGSELYISCPTGVSLKLTDGSILPCNQTYVGNNRAVDSLSITAINISGSTRTVSLRLYPRDTAGTRIDAAAVDTTFTVGTVYQPITSFSFSPTGIKSGSSTKLTWTANYIDLVNIRFVCDTNLTIMLTGSTTAVPCNSNAFTSDLAANSSQEFTILNSLDSAVTLTANIFPMIGGGSYITSDVSPATVTVAGKLLTAVVKPTIASFSAAPLIATSTSRVQFSWSTKDASGANLQFSCLNFLEVRDQQGKLLPCNTPVLAPDAAGTGSATLGFYNWGMNRQTVHITLLPADGHGYVFTTGSGLDLTILSKGEGLPQTLPTIPTTGIPSSLTPAVSNPTVSMHQPITVSLARGSTNKQVIILQQFLALNTEIYPEASVSGYFGPATLAALKRFQKKYGIAKEGSAGFGLVGPATRAKINALVSP